MFKRSTFHFAFRISHFAFLLLLAGCGRSDSGPPPGAPTDTPELNVSIDAPEQPKPESKGEK
ncbi:MAG TPA: hypothetical protein VHZ24_11515 [Pirellulales bacterium]|nr:hypothetical protein [Pirellulales bacterium]